MVSEQNNLIAKKELRAQYKKVSKSYFRGLDVSAAIVENLKKILPTHCTVGAFRNLADEPCLDAILSSVETRFAYPRIDQNRMDYYLPESSDDFKTNEFGIFEPSLDRSRLISVEELSAILVPAVAYDRKLNRLGRGKGFYDRLLASYTGLKIGVCSVVQIANRELPTDPHDVAMDVVVTDQFLLRRFDA